ncbi:DUF86 domain-containing protein [Stygiolobus caldivivus]|uniref:DUF86 domain-containing protein n=1 Tax=Stygiolobus caldivivus TaxID=2824673 RepID=A0A8D5U7E7_9CREN|nr:HepT-like ribonuclease domain-containing protein [Stygiolobus caldivivus]BCU71110.1 hypothetical protein KN1_24070 [Stygiolobus caldivivus]
MEERLNSLISELLTAIGEMEKITSLPINEFYSSLTNRFSLRYSVSLSVESAFNIAVIILEKCFNEMVDGYKDAFDKLYAHGLMTRDVSEGLKKISAMRNIIIHRYWAVDDIRIYNECKEWVIKTLREFVNEVKSFECDPQNPL